MNKPNLSSELAVSTWSLHRLLGLRYDGEGAERTAAPEWGSGAASLLEIPAQAAAHRLGQIEICHFHFPSADSGYLADLRAALADAGVQCLTLLIDEGDITHPNAQIRGDDLGKIRGWIDVAGKIGAARVRVIAGAAAPDPEGNALNLSVENLSALARHAADRGVRVVTENWYALLDRPAEALRLLERLEGEVGLLLDFGNWGGERKYADLAQIAPWAESTHAKANFDADGNLQDADYSRCLKICADAGFTGPHSLIYDGQGFDAASNEWDHVDMLRDFARA